MKKYLTLLLLLFATLTVASSQNIPQYVDKKIHIEDVYNHFAIHHPHDVPLNKLIDGRIRNYAIYTFTIHNRSTLFMANLMGTEPQYGTSLELYYKRPTSNLFSCRNRAKNNIGVKETIKNQEKFGLEFDEDLTQIPIYCPVLYGVLEPGECELYSKGTSDMKNPTKELRTNVYLSPVGVDERTSIDIGHFNNKFSKEVKPGTFSSGDIWYKFNLDSINMISVVPLDTMGKRPVLKMRTYFQQLITSNEYPLNEDSLPQIKDFRCGVGEFNIQVCYPEFCIQDSQIACNGFC